MIKKVILISIGGFLVGCATLGLSRYSSKGELDRWFISGEVSLDYENFNKARKVLSRGDKMFQAGALIEATLYTPTYEKIDFLKEAKRTREPEDQIITKFKEIDENINENSLCFMSYMEHSTLELAKPDRWKMKARIDGGSWIELQTDDNSVPDYVVRGSGYVDWANVAIFCADAKGWMKANTIELNVFPPVFVNPGEALLEWRITN